MNLLIFISKPQIKAILAIALQLSDSEGHTTGSSVGHILIWREESWPGLLTSAKRSSFIAEEHDFGMKYTFFYRKVALISSKK